MRLKTVFGVAAAVMVATPALAGDLDFSKVKCKDFVAASKDEIGTVLTWLEGYYTKEDSPPILFEEKTVKDAKGLGEYCRANPDDDVIKAAEKVMPSK